MNTIAENWKRVRARVDAAAVRAGRDPSAVRIVVATKTKDAAIVDEVVAAGATELGENYVQEAVAKIPLVTGRAQWHLIGHLQRNKAARAAELFDVVQTVDSVALGESLAGHAARLGRSLSVLVEINLGAEEAKNGIPADRLPALIEAAAGWGALRLDGLMAIPPVARTADEARQYFRELHRLRDRWQGTAPQAPLAELSMGMSEDYEVAVEEGATIVRIGRALLGDRA